MRFKELADKKKEVFDEDIEALIAEEVLRTPEEFKFLNLTVVKRHRGDTFGNG